MVTSDGTVSKCTMMSATCGNHHSTPPSKLEEPKNEMIIQMKAAHVPVAASWIISQSQVHKVTQHL